MGVGEWVVIGSLAFAGAIIWFVIDFWEGWGRQ